MSARPQTIEFVNVPRQRLPSPAFGLPIEVTQTVNMTEAIASCSESGGIESDVPGLPVAADGTGSGRACKRQRKSVAHGGGGMAVRLCSAQMFSC